MPIAGVTNEYLLVFTHIFANVGKFPFALFVQILLLLSTTGAPGIDLQVGPVSDLLPTTMHTY